MPIPEFAQVQLPQHESDCNCGYCIRSKQHQIREQLEQLKAEKERVAKTLQELKNQNSENEAEKLKANILAILPPAEIWLRWQPSPRNMVKRLVEICQKDEGDER